MTDILKNWRTAPKESRTVSLRVNSIRVLQDFCTDNPGMDFDEALDHFVIYAFCHISRQELLKHVAEMGGIPLDS